MGEMLASTPAGRVDHFHRCGRRRCTESAEPPAIGATRLVLVNAAESNERVMREVMAAFERADVDGILAYYPDDDDFVYHDMTNPETPHRGREGMRGWLGEFFGMIDMSEAAMTVSNTVSEGDLIVGELELRATYVGDGAPEGGAPIVMHACVVQRIEAGRIREERLYIDSATVARQLEASATPE
jgi:ketosteroid isomerase-like protein